MMFRLTGWDGMALIYRKSSNDTNRHLTVHGNRKWNVQHNFHMDLNVQHTYTHTRTATHRNVM